MAEVIEKRWGTSEALIQTPLFELHRLRIKPLHRCSFHVHRHKWNAFYVLTGVVFINYKEPHSEDETLRLDAGGFATIRPGVGHEFVTKDCATEMLEAYYPESLSDDIIRRNLGGPL